MINKKRVGIAIASLGIVVLALFGGRIWVKISDLDSIVQPTCPRVDIYNITPQEVARLVNVKRVENGLKPLTVNEKLRKSSVNKAREMIDQDYFAHDSPDGTETWKFFKEAGYNNWRFIGENLARGYLTSSEIVDGWMLSQGHKEIMLNKDITEMGVAVEFYNFQGRPSPYTVLHVGQPK